MEKVYVKLNLLPFLESAYWEIKSLDSKMAAIFYVGGIDQRLAWKDCRDMCLPEPPGALHFRALP